MDTIPIPIIYKKWLIWPNTVLNNLYISDCDDTINGICLTNKTLKQCIDICDGNCTSGYWLQLPDNTTICTPLDKNHSPHTNPVYRLRSKKIYKELDNTKIYTFINKEIYNYPPDDANLVYYRDILNIKENIKKTTLGDDNMLNIHNSVIYMGLGSDINLIIIPNKMESPQIENNLPIRYGDEIQISIPGTNLLLRKSINLPNSLEWLGSSFINYENEPYLKIEPSPSYNRKLGDFIRYSDEFLILYNELSYITVDYDTLQLKLRNTNDKNITNGIFQFISKMDGYFCNNDICTSIPIMNTKPHNDGARYKENIIYRVPNCWNNCKHIRNNIETVNPTKHTTINIWIIVSIVIVSILIIILVIKFYRLM